MADWHRPFELDLLAIDIDKGMKVLVLCRNAEEAARLSDDLIKVTADLGLMLYRFGPTMTSSWDNKGYAHFVYEDWKTLGHEYHYYMDYSGRGASPLVRSRVRLQWEEDK